MEKSPEAFRTISEVADWLGVPTHVLRFWESRFSQVKPVKRAGGRRYYRPSDMLLLGGIKRLLHDDGMTIRGVQKLLREEGVRHIAAFSQPLDSQYSMRDATPEETPEENEVPPSPMAEDVEPEPVDNVVPLETPAPIAAEAQEAAVSEAQEDEASLDLVDETSMHPDASEGPTTATSRTEPHPSEEPAHETGDGAAQETEAEGDLSGAGREEEPEFAFLHRPAPEESGAAATAEPATTVSADQTGEPEPAAAPGLFSSRRGAPQAPAMRTEDTAASAPPEPPPAIPDTPDVPATDLTDDDPSVPRVRGVSARLRTDRLRTDVVELAVVARAVADLRAIRARL